MNRFLWLLLLAVLAIAPVPLGAFRPMAWSLIGLAVALITLGWLVAILRGQATLFWRGWLWPPAIVLFFILAWIGLQNWAPAAASSVHPIWAIASDALGHSVTPRIGADPEAASALLLRLLTSVMIFWLALQLGRDNNRATMLMRTLGAVAGLEALYGLVNWIAGNHYLLWFPRAYYVLDVTGTFVNRNTFATFAGVGLLACVVLVSDGLRRGMRTADPSLSWLGRRVAALAGWPTVYLVAGLLLAMAVVQSHSRMGLVATLCGVAVLLTLLRTTRQVRGWWPLLLPLVAGLAVVGSVGGATAERIASRQGWDSSNDRSAIYALTEDAIRSAPLFGSGYGSYPGAFPMYRDRTLPAPVQYTMAHDSYLELAMELGLPAAALAVLALAWLTVIALIGVFRRDRDKGLPMLAVSATVLIGVHSLLDFSVQIPAVQYWFAALLGMGVAQAFPTVTPRAHAAEPDDADGDL